ncbi:putative RNA-processing protein, partial [Candidatus Haloredivivus sp. G17]
MKDYPYMYARTSAKKAKLYKERDYEKLLKMDVNEISRKMEEGEYSKEINEFGSEFYNNVEIEGDPLEEMTSHKMVKAIGRGFNPEKAFKLAEEGIDFHHLDIGKFADTSNSQERLKGRVI